MQIKLTEALTEDDKNHLFNWRKQVFPIEGEELVWSEIKWHLIASTADGRLVAHIGYAGFEIFLGKNDLRTVVGVADVVVRPEHQGEHIPAKLFEFLHESDHAKKISELFILFCPRRLESYYQQHGYKKFMGTYTFLQCNEQSYSDKFILMYRGRDLSTEKKIRIDCEPW